MIISPTAKLEPNEHGHIADEMCTVYEYRKDGNTIRIRIAQLDPGRFVTGYDFQYACGNHHSTCGGPSSGDRPFASLTEAVEHERQHALKHFRPEGLHPNDSCVSAAQRRIAVEFTALLTDGWPLHQNLTASQLSLFGTERRHAA